MGRRATPEGRSGDRPALQRGPSVGLTSTLLTGTLLLTLIVVFLGGPAAANDGDEPTDEAPPSYGIRPAFYEHTTLPGGHHSFALEPGSSIEDAVEIFNFSHFPLRLDVYGADLIMVDGGGFAPAARDEPPRGAGRWIVPHAATVEVEARSRLIVPFTVTIPDDALPGEHPGTIVVEAHTSETQAAITMRSRLAQRVLITVPGEIQLGVQLGSLEAVRDGGVVRFTLPVGNTGNVTFTTSGMVDVEVDVRGPRDPLVLSPEGLYAVPDGEAVLTAVWDDPPWLGRARARAELDVIVGEHEPSRFRSDTITIWLVPWRELTVAGTVVLVVLLLLYVTRVRRRSWLQRRRAERAMVRAFRTELRAHPGGPADAPRDPRTGAGRR